MAQQPNTEPGNRHAIANLLHCYHDAKAREAEAKADAETIKAAIDDLLHDCDLAHVAGMELARVAPGMTRTWDTAGLLRYCDPLRHADNGDLADAIMVFLRHGERQGYFRIAAIRDRTPAETISTAS